MKNNKDYLEGYNKALEDMASMIKSHSIVQEIYYPGFGKFKCPIFDIDLNLENIVNELKEEK